MNLKLLTLNLHCFAESNMEEKQKIIAKEISTRDVDIIFLQEVAQLETKENMAKVMISKDNYGLSIKKLLKRYGKDYNFYYEPIKRGFNIYQEGVGILSKYQLSDITSKYISNSRVYDNWKSRKVLYGKLEIDSRSIYLATAHLGWTDEFEQFENQFDLAVEDFDNNHTIFAGDFNVTPESKEYEYIKKQGWIDILAQIPEITFIGDVQNKMPARIDYFMSNKREKLINQEILFKEKRVSDHFGVYIEIEVI